MLFTNLSTRLAAATRILRRRARLRLGTPRLREKLAAPYIALALMAAICGLAGLAVVYRIAGTVTTLTGVTAPLLGESVALINDAHEMRSAYLNGTVKANTAPEEIFARLSQLDNRSRAHIARAQEFAGRVGLTAQFDVVANQERNFLTTLRFMIDAYGHSQRASASVIQRQARVNAALETVEKGLHDIGMRLETRIIENEEAAKVQIQAGAATIDGIGNLFAETVSGEIPLLQYSYRLTRATLDFQHLAQDAGSAQNGVVLASVQMSVNDLLKTSSGIVRKLSSRLRAGGDLASAATLAAAFDTLKESLLGDQGLFAAKEEALAAAENIEAGTSTLDGIESLYLTVLSDVEKVVRARNEASRVHADRSVDLGLVVILALVVLSALLAWGTAALLRRGIILPLKRVTDHVVRNSSTLAPISDTSVLRSRDELGDLARAFNRMMGELTHARQQLIARSEAEINKQVARLEAALKNMSQGLCMFDREQRLVLANEQYANIYGVEPDRIRPGMTLREIVAARVEAGSYSGDAQTHVDNYVAANTDSKRSNTIIELNNGRSIHIVKEPMKEGGWVATFEDVTERRQVEARIAHMARHDALTGLPNRILLHEKMEEAFARVRRGEKIAVHCVDLDNFKVVNDTLGHPIGDALLRAVTERLLDVVREHDTISRLGGDEFAIIQVVEDASTDASNLARRVIDTLSQPYELDSHQVVIGASIGIALAPDDGRAPDELLKNADLALYRAKADGRGTFRFFEAEMDARMQARRRLELDLRKALVAGEFELFYQPLIHLASDRITGMEALLRWRHPHRGLIGPAEFIPVLEEIALIVPVGEWVLKEACRQAAAWPGNLEIAVNLSPLQFKSRNLVPAVKRALAEARLPPHRWSSKSPETVLLQESESTLATLHELKELGVKIAMDDFGTGYSSLSYLRSFPFDRIKIDRSFVRDIGEHEESIAIVRAVATLGDSLGISTTAEGVETQAQLDTLRAEGCTDVQGFFFSPPKPADEIGAMLAAQEGSTIAA